MHKKLIIILSIYASLIFLAGCLQCDDTIPFYDFDELAFYYPSGLEINESSTFDISIQENNISYLASQSIFSNIGLINSAWATQPCAGDGNRGKKFPISSVEITSNANWDSLHLAGASLKDVVFNYIFNWQTRAYEYSYSWDNALLEINDVDHYVSYGKSLTLRFPKPILSQTHQLTFVFTKANSETVEATTETITWE